MYMKLLTPVIECTVEGKNLPFSFDTGASGTDLFVRYYNLFRNDVPAPDLVIYLQATPEVLKQRLKRKDIPNERAISESYLEQTVRAYEHFFFHYTASDLLVVNTSDIDFVNNNSDLKMLMRRLAEPVKGTQYFLPLGAEAREA